MGPEVGGSLNPNDLATLSLLYGGGRGGGPGVGGGSYGGYGHMIADPLIAANAHVDGSATKEAIDCNAKSAEAGLSGIRQDFENATRDRQVAGISKGQVDAERRVTDAIAASLAITNDVRAETAKNFCDVEKTIAEAAKDAAKCCCDAQLQACKDHAELKALVIEENARTRELIRGDALVAANAKITQLETINALSGNGHH